MRILALDPGSDKCGLAVTDDRGAALWMQIVPRSDILRILPDVITRWQPAVCVVGNGTQCASMLRQLADTPVVWRQIDEYRSTEEARKLYLQEHPARGWQRLLPHWLRTPDRPVDDYAALVLARRYIMSGMSESDSDADPDSTAAEAGTVSE